MNLRSLKFILIALTMIGCASAPKEKVIVRSDDLKSRPSWANFSQTSFVKEGRLFVVGISENEVDSRISAVSRIADNNARFEISRQITDDLSFIFQNMEEGVGQNLDLTRFYASEISKHMSHGIRQENRYWEKIQTFNTEGEPVLKLRVFSLASIRESDLRSAIKRALDAGNFLDPALKDQINQHLTREIQKLGQN